MDLMPKVKVTRAKLTKWDDIKLKLLCNKGHHQQNEELTGQSRGQDSVLSLPWPRLNLFEELRSSRACRLVNI